MPLQTYTDYMNDYESTRYLNAVANGRSIDAMDDFTADQRSRVNLWNLRTEAAENRLKTQQQNARRFERKRWWYTYGPLVKAMAVALAVGLCLWVCLHAGSFEAFLEGGVR
jgi:hypothetical protein